MRNQGAAHSGCTQDGEPAGSSATRAPALVSCHDQCRRTSSLHPSANSLDLVRLSPAALVLCWINDRESAARLARWRDSLAFRDRDLVSSAASTRPNLFVLPGSGRPLPWFHRLVH